MSMNTNGMTVTTSSTGYAVIGEGNKPVSTPAGLLNTRAVETIEGWVGQIILDKNIIWQSEGFHNDSEDEYDKKAERRAVRAANQRVIERLAKLFADDSP
jgi:hypothetical protein